MWLETVKFDANVRNKFVGTKEQGLKNINVWVSCSSRLLTDKNLKYTEFGIEIVVNLIKFLKKLLFIQFRILSRIR